MNSIASVLSLAASVFGVMLVLDAPRVMAQAKDPLVGEWVLDRGKSEYNPENTLQRRTLSCAAKGAAVNCVQRTVVANGNTVESEYLVSYDGKDNPISGSVLDLVSFKKADANTLQRTGKAGGKAVETATYKFSNGGKTLTMVTKGSVDGNDYDRTEVFDRQ